MTYDLTMTEKIEAERGNVKTITAWAICDNDGGRLITPRPLARHIYTTRDQAEQVAKFCNLPREHYPIRQVCIAAPANVLGASASLREK